MNEQEAYKTVIREQIADDDRIRRYARAAAPERKPALRVWKPVAIALAALLVVFGVTMAIPSARAEVFSWFAPTSAQEYFTEDPESREPNEALDALIVPGAQSETHVEIHYAAEEEVYSQIAKALETAEFGDTMFDGESLYIRMRVNGLGMLPGIETMTGGNLTKNILPPESTAEYFEDGKTPPEFLSGEVPFWSDAETLVTYTFADGTQINGGQIAADYGDIQSLLDSLRRDNLDNGWYSTPEQFAAINERETAYLRDRTVHASISTYMKSMMPDADMQTMYDVFRNHADENGRVTVTVDMQILHDLGREPWTETMLSATLGQVTVDLDAYKSLRKTALMPDGNEAVFAPEKVFFSLSDWKSDENGVPYCTYINRTIDLDGLTLQPQEGAYIDARGIQNLCVMLTPPESWDRKMLENLNSMDLDFDVLINGEPQGHVGSIRTDVTENGSVLITIGNISGVPLDQLNGVKTVTLIPKLSYIRYLRIYAESDPDTVLSDIPLEPDVEYTMGTNNGTWIGESTPYPQYAITFTAN